MLDGILKKLFGDKSQKDLKELSPIINDTAEEFVKVQQFSDDELREQTLIFKEEIKSSYQHITVENQQLKQQSSSSELSIQDKEALFEQVEKLEKDELIKRSSKHHLTTLNSWRLTKYCEEKFQTISNENISNFKEFESNFFV